MIGIYFSGTGNSKYCVEKFVQEYDEGANTFSIEDNEVFKHVKQHDELVIGYPVQYSSIPKILRDFIVTHHDLWIGKNIFVIATMGLFSGDGAGMLARLLKKYGAIIVGGLHLKMPDSIADEKVLKRPLDVNKQLVVNAENKIREAVQKMHSGRPQQEGLGIFYHLAGLFGQRLYFYNKTKHYSAKLKINTQKCIGCGNCAALCPMQNITLKSRIAVPNNHCTLCYRCVSFCPRQAITLLGKRVIEQSNIQNYL